jgi:hypothetical protein
VIFGVAKISLKSRQILVSWEKQNFLQSMDYSEPYVKAENYTTGKYIFFTKIFCFQHITSELPNTCLVGEKKFLQSTDYSEPYVKAEN